jgi:hypothetical protein
MRRWSFRAQTQFGRLTTPPLDALHPVSLPGGVRDAWASLFCAAQPLGVIAGDAPDAVAAASALALGRGKGPVAITAVMIERELARGRRHENEGYGMNGVQLSVARRTAALRSAVAR